ncbi:MAG TPA: NUDIX hydrolase [Thermomicrobiales bacterium]|nr:NUDIX hydrolase [Thermomicrobiales bacterium]
MEERFSSEVAFDGKLVRVRVDQVRTPSGRLATREVVEHPGAVAILPVHDDGRIVLVRQFRYAVGRELLEVPAGTREPKEAHLQTAIRELHEEVGYAADSVELLLRYFISPGWCNEELIVYRATGLRDIGARPEQDENLSIVPISPDAAPALIAAREIADAKTITAILAHLRDSG